MDTSFLPFQEAVCLIVCGKIHLASDTLPEIAVSQIIEIMMLSLGSTPTDSSFYS